MKATSIFGGVQVFNILITLVRGKVVALLIGPAGMGLNGLFLSGLNLVKNITSLGIEESAVKDLAATHSKDKKSYNLTYSVFKSWIWFTAILGMLISILFAPLLSRFAFGNDSQTYSFIFLSATFVFGALTGGIYTLLRATRKIKQLARANIYGSVSGLLVTLPILYFYGIDGVMPSIIAASGAGFLVSLLFRKFVDAEEVELSIKEKFDLGKPMVGMGINMSLSTTIGLFSTFIVSIFITRRSDLGVLGLFNAANSIIGGYIGMIFTAMSADYFPRLSEVADNAAKWKNVINHQIEILLLALLFILPNLILFLDYLIEILLSSEFLKTVDFIHVAAVGIPFKGLLWAVNYTYLSKGDSRIFLYTQMTSIPIFLLGRIMGFEFYGLVGLALFEVFTIIFVFLFNYIITSKKYLYKIEKSTLLLCIFVSLLIVLMNFLKRSNFNISIYILILLTLLSSFVSIYQLNKKTDFIQLILTKLKR